MNGNESPLDSAEILILPNWNESLSDVKESVSNGEESHSNDFLMGKCHHSILMESKWESAPTPF